MKALKKMEKFKPKKEITTKQIILVVLVIFAISLFLYQRYILTNLKEEEQTLDSSISKLSADLKNYEEDYANLEPYKQSIVDYKNDIEFFNSKIFSYPNTVKNLIFFEKLAIINDIVVKDLVVGDPVKESVTGEEGVFRINIKMNVEGLYYNIKNFIEQLKQSQNVFILDQLNLKISSQNQEND